MPGSILSIDWNQKEFSEYLRGFLARTHASTAIVLRAVAVDLLTRVIWRTPVATGRARAGWALAARALGVPCPAQVTYRGQTYNWEGQTSDLGSYEEKLTGSDEQQFISITNRVNYIMPLEYGWSKQQPLGMVRISMLEVESEGALQQDFAMAFKDAWDGVTPGGRFALQGAIMREAIGGATSTSMLSERLQRRIGMARARAVRARTVA